MMELRKYRRSFGLTQQELARQAQVSRSLVSHVETGRVSPSAQFAGRICEVFSAKFGQPVFSWEVFPDEFEPPSRAPARRTA
jgi:DNA-binding XRE family transcriptional regulator